MKSLAILGFYSRNKQISQSDLDILIDFSGEFGIRFIDLADELEDNTREKVDLVS